MEQAWRNKTPTERVERAMALTILVHSVALAEIRRCYPHEDERTHRMRLASRYIDAKTMLAAFGWDSMKGCLVDRDR